jgi:hypothetical protein
MIAAGVNVAGAVDVLGPSQHPDHAGPYGYPPEDKTAELLDPAV